MKRSLLCLALLTAYSSAQAITDDQAYGGLQINFSNPGSRALGMAGATLAVAEDGTAAYTNPAALLRLSKDQFSSEFKITEFSTNYLTSRSASASGQINLGYDDIDSDTFAPSFLSYARVEQDWALGFYALMSANYESRVDRSAVDFSSPSITQPTLEYFPQTTLNALLLAGQKSTIDLEVYTVGTTYARKISDYFSVGFGIGYSTLDINSTSLQPEANNTFSGTGSDSDFVYTIGLLGEIPNTSISWALSYRAGGDFKYDYSQVNVNSGTVRQVTLPFSVPDVAGLGLGYSSADGLWRVGLDLNWINYSSLTDGYDPITRGSSVRSSSLLSVDDGLEVRLGVERAFLVSMGGKEGQAFLRAGVWRDPDHQVFVRGRGECAASQLSVTPPAGLTPAQAAAFLRDRSRINGYVCDVSAAVDQDIFPRGDKQTHWTVGAGIRWSSLVLNAGIDFSDEVDTASTTITVEF